MTRDEKAVRNSAMVDAFRGGATLDWLTASTGLSAQMVRLILVRSGCSLPALKRGPKVQKSLGERDLKMVSMYRQGLTLAKIGEQFGITRERVRQLLSKQGISRADGGASLGHAQKIDRALRDREARCQLKYGVSIEMWKHYNITGATRGWREQKRNADLRAIEFRLTFKQWVSVWEASGKFHLRGRGIGKYCMSRIRDDGCYEVGNVHIQLITDNSREAVEKWRGKTKEHRGVFHLYPGRDRAWKAVAGGKTLGYFTSQQEAVAARAAALEA